MRAAITDQPIDTQALLEQVAQPAHGAALLFVGTVRDLNEGRPVTGIRYEAYHEMAESMLAQIAAEAEARSGCEVAVVHRTGELGVGEASVAIAVSGAHRAPAFDAARYIIEEIKKRLPVWKHEHYASGETDWVSGVVPAASSPSEARERGARP